MMLAALCSGVTFLRMNSFLKKGLYLEQIPVSLTTNVQLSAEEGCHISVSDRVQAQVQNNKGMASIRNLKNRNGARV